MEKMEALKEWIAGLISFLALVTTWILYKNSRHKSTHKDIYDKLDKKADADFVKEELKKMNDHLNERLDSHTEESKAIHELILEQVQQQNKLFTSMDDKLNILIQNQIKK